MNERYNIGILVANIMDSFSNRVSKGGLCPELIETVDGCHKWLMRNAPAENVSVINRIFKYAVIKISNGMINDFKKLEDSQKEHTHLSNLFTRDTLMFNENMAMSYARMMNKFYCLDIKSSYLFPH